MKAVTHEDVDAERLGGAATHTTRSGVAHIAAPDEATALATTRRILSFLPQNNVAEPPRREGTDPAGRREPALDHVVPDDPSRPYDMHDVIHPIVDDADFLEIQPGWAQNVIVGFARLDGRSVGIVAQQPSVLAGALDIDGVDEGRPVRPDLRLLQHPAGHLRRRARLPAWRRAGRRRDHPPRREAALRLLRGDGAEADGHHPQGLRRRV